MITLYRLREGIISHEPFDPAQPVTPDILWIDLLAPTDEERDQVSSSFSQQLPSDQEIQEIEASSRYFFDQNGLHIRSLFLFQFPDRFDNVNVAFLLNEGRLFTIRPERLETIHDFKRMAASGALRIKDNFDLLFALLAIKVDRLADTLERLHGQVEEIGRLVYLSRTGNLEKVLLELGVIQDINDKARLGMMDMQRFFSFLDRSGKNPKKESKSMRNLVRDIESLLQHSTFLFDKGDSLVNVTMGLINIEQNKIIKIFSIVSVVFLPPTLVASIYGMNYEVMPELHWPLGYLFALGLMLASACAPYLLFKRKGWL